MTKSCGGEIDSFESVRPRISHHCFASLMKLHNHLAALVWAASWTVHISQVYDHAPDMAVEAI
jgi:hypothetical protein